MKTEDFLRYEINRRQFLHSSARNAAGVAAGMVGLAGPLAHAEANERVALGAIGVRRQGKFLATSMAGFPDVEVTAICDVDQRVLPDASHEIEQAQGRLPRWETDFRRILDDSSIDGVIIGTPDHWHALMTVLACQAGKDVYVEKPVSHNVIEGQRMVDAARKYGRVVQAGTQQRSGEHFRTAVELLRSGRLGKVHLAKAWIVHRRKSIGRQSDETVPQGVDFDMWLGPAPVRSFRSNRFHYNWRWFWDYGTGEMGNWGVHMLDIARWGLDVGLPSHVSAVSGMYYFNDDQETPDTQLVQYTYPGKTITWEHRLWSTHPPEGRNAAAAFYGDKGTLVVDRGGWKVYDQKEGVTSDTSEQAKPHHRNFIDCMKTRELPAADIEIGHVTSTLCHLGNISHHLGRGVDFDPQRMDCGDDGEANSLLGRDYRSNWQLPDV